MRLILGLLCIASLVAGAPRAADPVYPIPRNIACDYALSDSLLSPADTLTVSRSLTNNESFPLAGLYFSDLLPPGLTIVDYSARIDSLPVDLHFSGPRPSSALLDHTAYRWTLDSPGLPDNPALLLPPGSTLHLHYRLAASNIGRISLPLHTAAAFGPDSPAFSFGEDSFSVVIVTDSPDDQPDPPPPASFLLTRAYPNPFNAEVTITYAGSHSPAASLRLEIVNTLGRRVALITHADAGQEGTIRWSPDPSVGTGVFLYRLTCGEQTASGKLLLLK